MLWTENKHKTLILCLNRFQSVKLTLGRQLQVDMK